MFFGTTVRILGIVCVSSQSFGVRIVLHLFCWIPNSMRKILKKIENYFQPAVPVGKPAESIGKSVHYVLFSETVRVLDIVCVSSHSF